MKALLLVVALFGPVQDLDRAAQAAVQGMRRPALETPMSMVTRVTKPVYVIGGLVVVAIVEGNLGAGTARTALIALAGANLVVEALKRLTFRARPDGEHRRSNASFPSGHSGSAFALAAVLARRWRRTAVPWFALATLVAFSRMYLNRHWLSDVVAGAAIGLAAAWAVYRWVPPRARHERPEESPPISDLAPGPPG